MTNVSVEETFKINGRLAATLVVPSLQTPCPGVLLLHGFASCRDEVGDLFKTLAASLSDAGIASLRIDFSGWGDSEGDMAATTVEGQVSDALLATGVLRENRAIDSTRLGLLGFSFGGGVAAAVASRAKDTYRSVVLWGSIKSFSKDMLASLGKDVFREARNSGAVTVNLGWRTVRLNWSFFKSLTAVNILVELASFNGPVLAIAGSNDRLARHLPRFADSRASCTSTLLIESADHIFNVLSPNQSRAAEVIAATTNWFRKTLLLTPP